MHVCMHVYELVLMGERATTHVCISHTCTHVLDACLAVVAGLAQQLHAAGGVSGVPQPLREGVRAGEGPIVA